MRYALLGVLTLSQLVIAQSPLPLGFSPATADAHSRAERIVLDTITPDSARKWLAALTEEPHVAGTPAEKKLAEYVDARFLEFGLSSEIVRYDVFLNHPLHVSLKLVAPVEEDLKLREDAYDVDKDSTHEGMFPAFHGYGASGKAEGQVVYANYAVPADFTRLEAMGISVAGKIVLARYGGAFRGLKVKEAQDRGALGVLIYSDPRDDGYMAGEVYPDGPMRPPSAIQRGSVLFLSHVPGDPSTPGWPSTPGAKRLARGQMTNVPKIPSLPIAYAEAEKILRRLGGPVVPSEWQGGLPFTYRIGPGGARVAMDVRMDEGLKPIYNVIATIPGSLEPDKKIILGNHRDAWTHGAVDPNSGTAAQLEVGRALAAALKTGWRPKRTIILASWDAEEYGLVGSTEWAEANAADLQKNAVAYLNGDAVVTGSTLNMSGSPSLLAIAAEVARDIPDPTRGGSVGAGWTSRQRSAWAQAAPIDLTGTDTAVFKPRLAPLGSGSDYTVFLDHLGIPSFDFSFSGSYGVYHSVYDNFRWMEKYGDPGFHYHAAGARLWAVLAMRLAAADVVPLRYASYAQDMQFDLDTLRRDVIRRARTADPKTAFSPDFSEIVTALQDLRTAGEAADRAADTAVKGGDAAAVRRINATLTSVESAFLDPKGLPGRPWFRHMLIGPGLTTGYAPWPFPALQEAVEAKDAQMFAAEAKRVVAAISKCGEAARSGDAVAAERIDRPTATVPRQGERRDAEIAETAEATGHTHRQREA